MTTPDPHLQRTLNELMRTSSTSNPALSALLDDYATEHRVTASVCALFLLALGALGVFCWKRMWSSPPAASSKWTAERKTYLSFAGCSGVVGLLLTVVIAANVSNARNPREGFSGSIAVISTPKVGTKTDRLHRAFDVWLQSGRREMPSVVRSAIDRRGSWQRPKAIICSVLLAGFVVLSARIWGTRMQRARLAGSGDRRSGRAHLAAGVGAVFACLALMLMVVGNTAASFAPVTLTLLFG